MEISVGGHWMKKIGVFRTVFYGNAKENGNIREKKIPNHFSDLGFY